MIKLSYFSKGLYDKCPASWKARYIDRISGPSIDKRMAYEGSVWHLLMEHWQKLSSDLDPKWLYDNIDLYIDLYLKKNECRFKSAIDQVTARQKICKMIDGGLAVMGREGLIKKGISECECKKAFIKDKVQLNVRIDLIFDNPDCIDIYDYKGVGRYAGLSYEQLAIYRLAGSQEFNKPVRHTAFIMGLFAELVPYQENLWSVSRVEEEFLRVAEAIERQEFPRKPGSTVCRECVSKEICPEVYDSKKRRSLLNGRIKDVTGDRKQITDIEAGVFRITL